MQRDMRLEGGGLRSDPESFSCGVGLVARVWSRRAYMCSASAFGTKLWSVWSFRVESMRQLAVGAVIF
jgi:hypothetical protein